MRSLTTAIVISAGVLAGCGGSGDEPSPDSTTPTPSAAPRSLACALLTAEERRELTGSAVDEVIPSRPPGDTEQCRWVGDRGDRAPTFVQTITSPADVWAQAVPDVLDNYERTGDITDDDRREIEEAKRLAAMGSDLSPDQACALFTTMAEIGGAPQGSNFTVSYTPIVDQLAASAQICTSGTFTSVLISKPDLEQSSELDQAMTEAVQTAHDRAVSGE